MGYALFLHQVWPKRHNATRIDREARQEGEETWILARKVSISENRFKIALNLLVP
jgi:hypothetical protein